MLKIYLSCYLLIKLIEIITFKKPLVVNMAKLKVLGSKTWISLTTNLTPCMIFVKAKVVLYLRIVEELITYGDEHTHAHTDTFPSLPDVYFLPPSYQHGPSAPPQNQILLIER